LDQIENWHDVPPHLFLLANQRDLFFHFVKRHTQAGPDHFSPFTSDHPKVQGETITKRKDAMVSVSTHQKPLPSGFGLRTTALEAIAGIDLHGKTAIVTGGYSGLGLETVRALASAGARVIVAARRPDVAAQALARVGGGIEVAALDLSDPVSIDRFGAAFDGPLHILINNAAIMANPLTRDARGYESQFATNHLGHFQLVGRLWNALIAAEGARVVSLSSIGHRICPANLDDPNFDTTPYDKWQSYGRAKSANALFAVGLDARGKALGLRAFAVHPGGIMTNLQRFLPMDEQIAMGWIDSEGNVNKMFKTPEQGAATSIWCATSPKLDGLGGLYCEDCDVAKLWEKGDPPYGGVHAHGIDGDAAEALWQLSEKMTGVTYP
jgi:NAD(P)-dependent dehydrogenase (short-subunit alcohol dehydrogenase family)